MTGRRPLARQSFRSYGQVEPFPDGQHVCASSGGRAEPLLRVGDLDVALDRVRLLRPVSTPRRRRGGDTLRRLVARSNADLPRVIDRMVGFAGIVRASTAITLENPVSLRITPLVRKASRKAPYGPLTAGGPALREGPRSDLLGVPGHPLPAAAGGRRSACRRRLPAPDRHREHRARTEDGRAAPRAGGGPGRGDEQHRGRPEGHRPRHSWRRRAASGCRRC